MPRHSESSARALGRRLRSARVKAGLSQRQIGEPGITSAYISRIEAGERFPTVTTIRRLAVKLNVGITWLETGRKQPPLDEVAAWIKWFALTDACRDLALEHGEDPSLIAGAVWLGLREDLQ